MPIYTQEPRDEDRFVAKVLGCNAPLVYARRHVKINRRNESMGLVERIRRMLLIPTWAQWQRWSLTAKLTGVGTLVGVVGLVLGIYMAIPATVIDAYAVDGSSHDRYLELFRIGQFGQRDKLRIGCVEWSEASCVAAGNFLRLLSEAGWEIDSDAVFRMRPSVPVDGVSIVSRGDDMVGLPKVPPHMGHWSRPDASQGVLTAAFELMGGPVHFSSDPTLQPGTIGVYFGPKPKLEAPIKQANEKVRRELLSYVGSGMVVQRACSQESAELCAGQLFSWEESVSSFLKQQELNPNAVSKWFALPQAKAVSATADMNTKLNVLMPFVLGVE